MKIKCYMWSACLNTNCFGKGLLRVSVQAMNALSASDVDVDLEDILEACHSSPDPHGNSVRGISNTHMKCVSSYIKFYAFFSTDR